MSVRYSPARGGHAPSHLRYAFLHGVGEDPWSAWPAPLAEEEAVVHFSAGLAEWWAGQTVEQRARWLTGQLWNCSDVVPSTTCMELDLPQGSTYARAARHLRSALSTS